MALSESVENSLRKARESLRNALAFAARQERPIVCSQLAEIICRLEAVANMDDFIDKVEQHSDKFNI